MNLPTPDTLAAELRERAARVRLLALDVDGTLTDGRLLLAAEGIEIKAFHAHDGQGLKILREVGIEIALITARTSDVVTQRAGDLGIKHVHQGCHDKRSSLRNLSRLLDLEASQVAFMGDDLPDLAPMGWCGFSIAPANAHPWVRERAHLVTRAAGGQGAARELCDLILDAKGLSAQVLRRFTAP